MVAGSPRWSVAAEFVDEMVDGRPELGKLLQVDVRESAEGGAPAIGQLQSDDTLVVRVGDAPHHPQSFGAVGQFHRGVVAEEEIRGDLADRRAVRFGVAANGQQQLVLAGGQPVPGRLLGAPALKCAKSRADREQSGVIQAGDNLLLLLGPFVNGTPGRHLLTLAVSSHDVRSTGCGDRQRMQEPIGPAALTGVSRPQ